MRQPPGHRVPRRPLGSAATTPPVELARLDPARQHRTIRLDALTNDLKAELVDMAERGQVRESEGSVRHVEVFRLGCVRTPIIGRPRPSPSDRRAERYTFNSEEPVNNLEILGAATDSPFCAAFACQVGDGARRQNDR
jgi:hypothetical protein